MVGILLPVGTSEPYPEAVGVDFGEIVSLVPLARGVSGRIVRLRIVGTKVSRVVGKELFIRRILSASHLYSSAFTVHPENVKDGIPQSYTLKGGRLGAWSRSLSDRCGGDGDKGVLLSGNIVALLS